MAGERARPPEDISPEAFFCDWVPQRVAEDPARRRQLGNTDARVEFRLEGSGGGAFGITISDGAVQGEPGPVAEADLRVRVSIEDWRSLNAGRLSAPRALLERRLKMSGDLGLALKLHLILG